MFAGNFAPRQWAFCDGQLLPISSNSALFSILGTTYGGDGRTTFALPDLRGRVPIHQGHGPGLSDYRLGQKSGAENVTLTVAQLPSHNHSVGGSESGATKGPENAVPGTPGAYSPSADVQMAASMIGNTGGNQGHPNLQPYTVVNFIIAVQGIFPSRG